MSAGYDGQILIDTRINTKGVNSGVKSISNAFGNILKTVKTIGTTLAKAFSVGALVLFSASVGKIISTIRESMGELLKRSGSKTVAAVEDIQNRFKELKLAVANAFLPLVIAALPYIKMVISWLTKAMNYLSMFFAALMGQKQVLQVIEGSTQAVAENMENTTEQAKKALGALAGFDQISVLDTQQQESPTTGGPDLTNTTTTALELVPITDEILKKVEDIKKWFSDVWENASKAWENIKRSATEAWEWIVLKWGLFSEWWKEKVSGPLGEWMRETWEKIKLNAGEAWAWLVEKWTQFSDWWRENVSGPLGEWMSQAWEDIKKSAGDAWEWVVEKWGLFKEWFQENVSGPLGETMSEAWENMKKSMSNVKEWFSEKWAGVKEWFLETWKSISMGAENAKKSLSDTWSNITTWFNESVIDPIKNIFSKLWTYITILANNAWVTISYYWGKAVEWFQTTVLTPLMENFTKIWAGIQENVSNAWANIKEHATKAKDKIIEVWGTVSDWIKDNVGEPIKDAFEIALEWVSDKFETIFEGLKDIAKDSINSIIGLLNGLLNSVGNVMNNLIDGANAFGATVPGWMTIPSLPTVNIPELATGAVIPPNARFAAVLGDQKSGMNIETPVALMQKTFDESLARALANQSIHISFDGDLGSLVRELKPRIDKENARIGGSLLRTVGG